MLWSFLPQLAQDGICLAVLLASGLGVGTALTKHLRDLDATERRIAAGVTGLAALGTALSLLALAGAFHRGAIVLLLVLVQLAWWRNTGRPVAEAVEDSTAAKARSTVGLLMVIAGCTAVWFGLYPPASFDDTMYHLPLARGLVEHGRLVVEPQLRYPIFPMLQEVLAAALLALGGSETSVHLLSMAELLLLAGIVWAWARRRAGEVAAVLAVGLLLGSPLVVWLGGAAYVDLALALFACGALWALDRAGAFTAGASTPDRGWLALAAGLAGAAAAVKYHGLFFCGVVALTTLRLARRQRQAAWLLPLALALPAAAPWYLRNLVLTGNPLFPFLSAVFGANAWSLPATSTGGPGGWTLAEPTAVGWAAGLGGLARLTLDLLRSPLLLLEESIRPTTVPALSPFASLILPLACGLALRRRELRALAAWLLLYLALWLLNVRDVRYLAPWAAACCVLAGMMGMRFACWSTLQRVRWLPVLFALLLLSPAVAFGALRWSKRGPPPIDDASRSRYLDRWLPGHALLACAGRAWGSGTTIYGLGTEQLQDYARGRLIGDVSGPYRHELVEPYLSDPARLALALEELGADALLVPAGRVRNVAPAGSALRRLAASRGWELWGVAARSHASPLACDG